MTDKIFTQKFEGVNVSECLRNASVSLGVSEENIKYLVLEEKKGFFKKHAVISVDVIEGLKDEYTVEDDSTLKGDTDKINGTIEVKSGKFIIVNPKEGGKPATISTTADIKLIVNGEKISKSTTVNDKSLVVVNIPQGEAKRCMDLRTSPDRMKAYISIIYEPNITYMIKDVSPRNSLMLEADVKEKKMPPLFTENEIKNELLNHNIKYGIISENIVECAKTYDEPETLVASGKKNVESINDRMEIRYNKQNAKNKLDKENDEDEQDENYKSVDYKAIGTVDGVGKGEVLAVLYPGKNGEDGIDVTGMNIVTKDAKKIVLCVGEGCKITDKCTVVSTNEGRPSSRGNTFFVYKTHKIDGDVELKTGNIQFVGDIIVSGSVNEGMKVEAGNSILVKNNVAQAEINASGDIVIKGNVINSNIAAGKEDVLTLDYLRDLKSMKDDVSKLVASISQIKGLNVIGNDTTDGELVKILLETKYKNLPLTSIKVAKRILAEGNPKDELLFIIKNKILNIGTLNINSYEELNEVSSVIDSKIATLDMNLTLPVDVVLDYCQDSVVKSSGNIILTGKGEYVSQMIASDSIIFKKDKSLARGGVIKAGKEIKCKIVGGMRGVSTKLIVESHGQIWADIAYQNTRFIVGDREYILEVASKNVHAYLDDARELVIDKLQL